eukprot:scaffold3180_cov399-Prasinococcus_capsulatus_cf.AAC.11
MPALPVEAPSGHHVRQAKRLHHASSCAARSTFLLRAVQNLSAHCERPPAQPGRESLPERVPTACESPPARLVAVAAHETATNSLSLSLSLSCVPFASWCVGASTRTRDRAALGRSPPRACARGQARARYMRKRARCTRFIHLPHQIRGDIVGCPFGSVFDSLSPEIYHSFVNCWPKAGTGMRVSVP